MAKSHRFGKKKEEAKKKKKASGSPSDLNIDTTGIGIPFTPGDIQVVEVPPIDVSQIGMLEGESEGNINEGVPEDDVSLESFQPLLNSAINIPALYFGTWWIRTPEQTDIFAKELYIYCQKKGINIRDYMFDELPLFLVGAQMCGGIYDDYKKSKESKEKPEEKADKDRLPGHKEHNEEEEVKE